jgi:hypothetical protein
MANGASNLAKRSSLAMGGEDGFIFAKDVSLVL